MGKSKLVTAIYCRLAKGCDDGIKSQELMVRKFAEENGHTNIKVYTDNGYGGHNYDRPAFSQLQADIEAGIVGTVLVENLSRITRNVLDIPDWVFDFLQEKTGIKFISVMDDARMFGSMQKDFQEAFTKIYKEMQSTKIKNGIKYKKDKALKCAST